MGLNQVITIESNGLALKHPTQEQTIRQSKGTIMKPNQNMHRKKTQI